MKEKIPGEIKVSYPNFNNMGILSLLKPYVRQTGNNFRDSWFLRERKILDYLLVYINGYGEFTIDNKVFPILGSEELFLIPPNTLHEMKGGEKSPMHCIYIHFDMVYNGCVQ